MEEKQYNLQAYADEHCGGDRFLAIYQLISSDEKGALDPYVDGMTRAEANFTFHYLRLIAIQAYGSEKAYRNELKINRLLLELEQTEESVKNTKGNPFVKRLWKELAKLLAAILLPLAAMLLFSLTAETVAIAESILIGLQAFNMADAIISVGKYRKLKKLMEQQPPMQEVLDKPSYETCLAMFQNGGGAISVQETEKSFRTAKDERVLSWFLLPAYSFLSGVGIILSYLWKPYGGILSFCVLFIVFFCFGLHIILL